MREHGQACPAGLSGTEAGSGEAAGGVHLDIFVDASAGTLCPGLLGHRNGAVAH